MSPGWGRLIRRQIYFTLTVRPRKFYFKSVLYLGTCKTFHGFRKIFFLLFPKEQKTKVKIDRLKMPLRLLNCFKFRKISTSWKELIRTIG